MKLEALVNIDWVVKGGVYDGEVEYSHRVGISYLVYNYINNEWKMFASDCFKPVVEEFDNKIFNGKGFI